MHILATTSASLESLIEPVDLAQQPADVLALSFSDADLAGLAGAWRAGRNDLPQMRLAALRDLRHPMSVDLWIEKTAALAKVVLVRLLGGYDWWAYGCDRLAAMARAKGIALVLLPGESSEHDDRLAELSTVSRAEHDALLALFRAGGSQNMVAVLTRLAGLGGWGEMPTSLPEAVAQAGLYAPGRGVVGIEHFRALAESGMPVVPLIFYRSALLAADMAPIDALAKTLAGRGILAVPLFVSSLRDAEARRVMVEVKIALLPRLLITTTAFAVGAEPGVETLFDELGLPILQVAVATTRREAWQDGERGLTPADLAMHVILPELDGRVFAGAISFKDVSELDAALGVRLQHNRPEPGCIDAVAGRAQAWLALQATPRADRRVAIIVPDYPAASGRAGYAVGLDAPQSVIEMLRDLKHEGYRVSNIPATARELMSALERPGPAMALTAYRRLKTGLSPEAMDAVEAAWGEVDDEAPGGAFAFRQACFGNVTVCFAPDRGRDGERRAEYHDLSLPPRHALIAFGLWLREELGCHAIVHVGAHGTLEWLPGKTVALSRDCFPEIVAGPLPVIYPFIVSNPGEAAQAKRRIAAITLGHLTPPLGEAGLTPEQQELERLVDEYAQADGLDRRRWDRLAALIVEIATKTGLAREAGVDADAPDEALAKIDAWLCDLKDFVIKDGLHVYGRPAPDESDPARMQSANAESRALIAALDGHRVSPGPSGAPSRGRTDVLPTGRNLYAVDPRTMPTPTAAALAEKAAEEIVRSYLQENGEFPRALVMDLWGSASLRTGGEEIAQGLALMGCRPQWDPSTGRVIGIEVLPPAVLGRPRVDVTWRISGLFRDMFPVQIALIDAAVDAICERSGEEDENPLAQACSAGGERPARIFGSAPGTYGAGIEDQLARGGWETREELGQAYLASASHAFGGAEGEGVERPGAFAAQVAQADLLVHVGDDPGRDILEGSADVAFVGGFSAAVAALGGKADIVMLDTSVPDRPRARSLASAVMRTVRARVLNRRFMDGQMRHGPRGASEFAETIDRLVGFAETTAAVSEALLEEVHDAYLGDPDICAFLLRENPAAARAIAERFASARRRGLWHPRRNSVDEGLAAMIAQARGLEAI